MSNESISATRNRSLDFLRFFGLLLIVLAHSGPPTLLFQLRNFDVPLMIVASAATYAAIYYGRRGEDISLRAFYKKRIWRLIAPAWLFLTIFFISINIFSSITGKPFPFSRETIVTSYLFYSGIGYVWVLKVFIVIALLTPPLLILERRVRDNRTYFSLLLVAYLAYEAVYWWTAHLPTDLMPLLTKLIFVLPPYAILYAYGLKIGTLSTRSLCVITYIALTIFVALAIYYSGDTHEWVATQQYKYPPRLYYLSYALVMINLCWLLFARCPSITRHTPAIVTWLSTHSLWIYLWHIMALYIWQLSLDNMQDVSKDSGMMFLIKFVSVLTASALVTALQVKLVKWLFPDPRSGRTASLAHATLV